MLPLFHHFALHCSMEMYILEQQRGTHRVLKFLFFGNMIFQQLCRAFFFFLFFLRDLEPQEWIPQLWKLGKTKKKHYTLCYLFRICRYYGNQIPMLDEFLTYLIHAKHEVTLDIIPRNQPAAILGIKTGCLGGTWTAWVFPLLTRAIDVNLLKGKGVEPLLGSMYIHGTDWKWSGGHSVLSVVLSGSPYRRHLFCMIRLEERCIFWIFLKYKLVITGQQLSTM